MFAPDLNRGLSTYLTAVAGKIAEPDPAILKLAIEKSPAATFALIRLLAESSQENHSLLLDKLTSKTGFSEAIRSDEKKAIRAFRESLPHLSFEDTSLVMQAVFNIEVESQKKVYNCFTDLSKVELEFFKKLGSATTDPNILEGVVQILTRNPQGDNSEYFKNCLANNIVNLSTVTQIAKFLESSGVECNQELKHIFNSQDFEVGARAVAASFLLKVDPSNLVLRKKIQNQIQPCSVIVNGQFQSINIDDFARVMIDTKIPVAVDAAMSVIVPQMNDIAGDYDAPISCRAKRLLGLGIASFEREPEKRSLKRISAHLQSLMDPSISSVAIAVLAESGDNQSHKFLIKQYQKFQALESRGPSYRAQMIRGSLSRVGLAMADL